MEPPLKRARLDIDASVSDAPLVQHGKQFIPLLRHKYDLSNTDGGVCKTLQKCHAPTVVELVGHSHTRIELRLPSKARFTFDIDDTSQAGNDFIAYCLKLPSSAKVDSSSTVTIAHYRANLTVVGGNFSLELSLLWHDDVHALDRVDPVSRAVFRQAATATNSSRVDEATAWHVKEFYDNVFVPDSEYNRELELPDVQCSLYPFQRRALHWMLSREGVQALPSGQLQLVNDIEATLPLDFTEVQDVDGSDVYVSPALCVASSERAEIMEHYASPKGGILSEAMGLGKTVEMIALICSHKRSLTPRRIGDPGQLIETGATLIITPPTILEQWRQELREHSPALCVCYYRGTKANSKNKDDIVAMLSKQDVVLTTYSVIASEIHYVQEGPDRNLRSRPRRPLPKSPLTKILWWRCLLDEAQMVETGVSNAAIVARLIPRVNAWAVTGTPLKQSHRDLHGLMLFLGHAPWCQSTRLWDLLIFYHRPLFRRMIKDVALRHSKDFVKNELRIPAQSRQLVVIPFTAIEKSHYAQLHHEMQHDVGLDRTGAPLQEDWDPHSPITIEKMRSWLQRLRQTCLHPEVGGRNRKALGRRGGGPLRTVAQVLDVMIEHTEQNVFTERRAVLMARVNRGRIMEHARDSEAAAQLFQAIHHETNEFVANCRKELAKELQNMVVETASEPLTQTMQSDDDESQEVSLTAARQRLRTALEILHICIFFIGNTYHQRKEKLEAQLLTSGDTTQQDDESAVALTPLPDHTTHAVELVDTKKDNEQLKGEIQVFEKQEVDAYEEAKTIRTELLVETRTKAQKRVRIIRLKKQKQDYVILPYLEYSKDDYGGIESRKVMEKLYHFCQAMNTQAKKFEAIREKMTDMLCSILVDEEEGEALTGEEYEDSTKHQDEMYVMMEMMRALFADRHDAISGQENLLLKQETKQFLRSAKEGEGPAPELMIKLLAERAELRIDPAKHGSLRGIITELRSLTSALEWQEFSSHRAKAELSMVKDLLNHVQRLNNDQTKSISILEQEIGLYRDAMNARLDYYRALQVISDTVAPIGSDESVGLPADQVQLDQMLKQEQTAATKLSSMLSKRRYLLNLKKEQEDGSEAKICTICQFEFEIGTLTVCGHQFCKECIQMWWKEHRNCPVCKRRLHPTDFYDVTYKPTLPADQVNEEKQAQSRSEDGKNAQSNAIYSTLSKSVLQEIKSIDIRGSSYGSKVDTLVRHILFLRKSDAGSKTVIFSQYRDFLDVLSRSLRDNTIIHSKFDDKDGIIDFKSNPANECFLLHAKAHSAGLNLVCANHVMLCEPLINTAIELQAIARVHRIGQIRETCVWMYVIENTVEEAIYEISARRRLAHMAHDSRDSTREHTPSVVREEAAVEVANAKELQAADLSKLFAAGRAGGEIVDKEDLWSCLFGNVRDNHRVGPSRGLADLVPGASTDGTSMGANSQFGSFLRAEAAEGRQAVTVQSRPYIETPMHD